MTINRRTLMLASGTILTPALLGTVGSAPAQTGPAAPVGNGQPPKPRFRFDDVVKKASEALNVPFDINPAPLPEPIARLDFDTWRDIRFKPDKAFFNQPGSPFRLQLFHPGFLYNRPMTVNLIRDGIPTPVPYAANLFDYGRVKVERPLPVGLGFAGFRLHAPLNDPRVHDELISFLGASYFRFLSRDQRYGLSARGLAINTGRKEGEEFPVFTDVWIETPDADADRVTLYALMQSASLTGAFQFVVFPGPETVVEVVATVFARQPVARLGLAPLTSMFLAGENDQRHSDDYRPELHDSDGLLIHSGSGEWLWRPLRNPKEVETSAFLDTNVRGFGLMQRDRTFEHYQDLDLAYERRPGYWIEPHENWGEGQIELIEIPTSDETNDNIVAFWRPKAPLEPGQNLTIRYRMRSLSGTADLNPGGMALNTFRTRARALGSGETPPAGSTRFIIDFAGGDLAFQMLAPQSVQIVASASVGKVTRAALMPNPSIQGFRAMIDIEAPPGQLTDLRAFLKAGSRVLTETWTYPWRAE
ncbi:MAG TPA: glucan biosynthesis protein G [Beijerinckiaceae bacterium]|nr:glucan biosynthesis protein G [Beijerinckiaceae bacterium]